MHRTIKTVGELKDFLKDCSDDLDISVHATSYAKVKLETWNKRFGPWVSIVGGERKETYEREREITNA